MIRSAAQNPNPPPAHGRARVIVFRSLGWICVCALAAWLCSTGELFTRSLRVLGLIERLASSLVPLVPRSIESQLVNPPRNRVFLNGFEPTLGGLMNDFGNAALARVSHDPLVANGTHGSAAAFALLGATSHVALALALSARIRRLHGRSAELGPRTRDPRLGLTLAFRALPALVLGVMVMRPLAMFWQSVWLESGAIAWVRLSVLTQSGIVAGAVLWLGLTMWIARRMLRASASVWSLGGRCGRCGYDARGISPCPECGETEPRVQQRSHLTPIGSWLEIRGWPRATAWIMILLVPACATFPVWSAAAQILPARVL